MDIKSFTGTISGIGDKDNNINIITGRIDASLLNMCIGYESGVVGGAYDEFGGIELEDDIPIDENIEMESGMVFAYGFKGVIDTTISFGLKKYSSTETREYYYIVAEFDTTVIPNTFKIKLIYNGFTDVKSFRQDNLIKNSIGVYQLPLYRFEIHFDSYGDIVISAFQLFTTINGVQTSQKAKLTDTQSENDKSEKIVNTELLHSVVDTNEEITLATDSLGNKVASCNFCRLGTTKVIANFDNWINGNLLTAQGFITSQTVICTITNSKLIPSKSKSFILQIIDNNGLLSGCKIQIQRNGQVVSYGKIYGASIETDYVHGISGTIVYDLEN